MRNYSNQVVYLGIDVHKKTYAVTAISDGQVVKKDSLKADPQTLIAYCKKYFPGARIESAYEAGFCGFHLHRCLEAGGIKNRVVDAAGMEIAVGDRVKTDKRDSLKIATHLAAGRLEGIRIPSPEREDYRIITRTREAWVKQRSRIACQLKSLLHQHGLIKADDTKLVSLKWLKALEEMTVSSSLKYALDLHISMWRLLDAQIKNIQEKLEEQAKEDADIEAIYRSVPGVGPTSARVLANELEDISQFSNERKIASYIGLTPSEYSSGEHVRQGHITRQGKPILRKILVQVAWKAVSLDVELQGIFERLAARVGKRKAIVAIARKLVIRMRTCFRTGELYRYVKRQNGDSLFDPEPIGIDCPGL